MITRGSYLVNGIGACGNCHTEHGPDLKPKTDMPFAGGEKFDLPFGTAYAKNLTPDVDTGIGTWTEAQIVRAFREGVTKEGNTLGPPMPVPYFNKISDDDARAIAAYLKSVKPIRHEVSDSKYKIELKPLPPAAGRTAPPKSDKVAYGGYLANIAHCVECHSTPGPNGAPDLAGHLAAGGFPFVSLPGKVIRSRNITSDPETGIGAWSDAEIKRALTQGINKSGKQLIPPMPYLFFKNLSAEDLDALVAWVRTLPPIKNEVPPNPPLEAYLQ
jgi:cytochrome c553